MVLSLNLDKISDEIAKHKLQETCNLAKSINLNILYSSYLRLRNPSPGYFLSRGILNKFKKIIEEMNIKLIIFNNTLSPIQQRNLEKFYNLKVIDRTNLILEIFGKRAMSHEGKLQVELAHLLYQKSRLVRTWTHLERQRGGFGFLGGPGETQLELDKRMLSQRIKKIKSLLIKVSNSRKIQQKNRLDNQIILVSIVGYTNAGKSTLFNKLLNENVLSKDMLFATLDPTRRIFKDYSHDKIIISDTVGFISDLPTELIESFKSTLEEISSSEIIIHVRDLSSPFIESEAKEVYNVLNNIDSNIESKTIEIFNKIDLYDFDDIHTKFNESGIFISAIKGTGLDKISNVIQHKLENKYIEIKIVLNENIGVIVNWLYENSKIVSKEINKHGKYKLSINISKINLDRMKSKFSNIVIVR
ncbi:MAG: GTPase HflX [Candidatus Puniceispirillales bacterium]